jgi:hypothetical protein
VKTVVVLPKGTTASYLLGLYFDRSTQTLAPNLACVDEDGTLLFETNSLRLRGPEPRRGQRLAVVWGDSVVFSVLGRSWPDEIDDGTLDCLFLNGGIEGCPYRNVLGRAVNFNRAHDVALNVIMLGWHPFPHNTSVEADLEAALPEIPNAVLVTQPTSLNESIAATDLRAFFRDASEGPEYRFWSHMPYSVPLQAAWFGYISERNRIVRRVAAHTGTPCIDLFAALDSRHLQDFREHFFDPGHPRPGSYATLASIIREAVRPLLDR